jgi:hypothetical protein
MLVTDMSRPELLMAAARAYDLPYRHWVAASHPTAEGLLLPNNKVFNPVLNPEQAIWLSLELHLSYRREGNTAIVEAPWAGIEPQSVTNAAEPMLALCQAITQAAAAVDEKGLSLKNVPRN